MTGQVWRIAALTAAGAVGVSSQADAARYYWPDSDFGYYYSRPEPVVQPRRHKARHQAKKIETSEKESAKPQGPVIIAISIEKQSLKIYDANGFFAEAPVSTGMKGHPTPMGVFSVIQKQKLHHSNIYSGAPMPYMQRITWSGIAIHAGVLPGYPASHGCIRMPMAFAVKMWNWTRMGARVVVTPGEITPANFSHTLLVAQKVAPQPEPQADAPPAPKSDKASDAGTPDQSAISAASLELRSTVGHGNGATPAIGESRAPASLRDQTHTADAGSAGNRAATMNDAAPAGSSSGVRADDAAPTGSAPQAAERTGSATPTEAVKPDVTPDAVTSETAKSEAEPAGAKPAETISSDDHATESKPSATEAAEAKPADVTQPAEAKLEEAKPAEITETKPAETASPAEASKTPDVARPAAPASGDSAQAGTSTTASVTTEAKQADEPKTADVKAETSAADAPRQADKAGEKPDNSAKAATDVGAGAADARKDQARAPDAAKPAVAAAPKRSGQIAVFISRKDKKLYARQNFEPLFDAPVTIAPSDRLLGTHVFTAQIDRNDANLVHWSVVSMPAPRHFTRDDDEHASRRRKMAGAAEVKEMPAPDSPAEALDRLTIPADAMARITDALSTGASIIVSDQGINQGETGEGTDFIVSLR